MVCTHTRYYRAPSAKHHCLPFVCLAFCPSFHFSFENWWSTDAFRRGWAGPLINQLDRNFVTQNYVKYLCQDEHVYFKIEKFLCRPPDESIEIPLCATHRLLHHSIYENSSSCCERCVFSSIILFYFDFDVVVAVALFSIFICSLHRISISLTIDEAKNRQTFIHCK